jgi:hypothetical protein
LFLVFAICERKNEKRLDNTYLSAEGYKVRYA